MEGHRYRSRLKSQGQQGACVQEKQRGCRSMSCRCLEAARQGISPVLRQPSRLPASVQAATRNSLCSSLASTGLGGEALAILAENVVTVVHLSMPCLIYGFLSWRVLEDLHSPPSVTLQCLQVPLCAFQNAYGCCLMKLHVYMKPPRASCWHVLAEMLLLQHSQSCFRAQ